MSEAIKKVTELLTFPSNLCKQCGACCNCVVFRDRMSREEILEAIDSPDASEDFIKGAKDFLSIFEPWENNRDIENAYPEALKYVLENAGKKINEITIFHCRRYKNGCTNYENRPRLCKDFPLVGPASSYLPSCGHKEVGEKRWEEIAKIMEDLKSQNA